MFTREEAKEIRQQFWIFFDKRYPRKWLLYNTGVKEINLKFSINNKLAQVSFDIETTDEIFRMYYFEKFESLKNIMKEEISQELIFDKSYIRSNGKEISRVYIQLDEVNIHKKTDWPKIFDFFNANMDAFEDFWIEYKDFIES